MIADSFDFLTGPVTLLISLIILLATGTLAFHFVGDSVIVSGIKREKKLIDKTEVEIIAETTMLREIKILLERIDKRLNEKA